jgi:hypothetical protein
MEIEKCDKKQTDTKLSSSSSASLSASSSSSSSSSSSVSSAHSSTPAPAKTLAPVLCGEFATAPPPWQLTTMIQLVKIAKQIGVFFPELGLFLFLFLLWLNFPVFCTLFSHSKTLFRFIKAHVIPIWLV